MRKQEKGAVSVEYILISALIAIALIVGWAYIQTQAEMNQKALTDVMARAASVSAVDASYAADVGVLMPGIQTDNAATWASKRVGGTNLQDYKWTGIGTYVDAGANLMDKGTPYGTP